MAQKLREKDKRHTGTIQMHGTGMPKLVWMYSFRYFRGIKLGIGDVTRPLAPCVVEAGLKAVAEMGRAETFRGYSPDSQGYEFLRDAISRYYSLFGVKVAPHEIHVSDGAKSDCGNIVDLFDSDRKSTRLNSSHSRASRMPSSA